MTVSGESRRYLRDVPEHFNPRGIPKRRFPSQEKAWEWRRLYGSHGLRAYLCPICDRWHLGHKRRKA